MANRSIRSQTVKGIRQKFRLVKISIAYQGTNCKRYFISELFRNIQSSFQSSFGRTFNFLFLVVCLKDCDFSMAIWASALPDILLSKTQLSAFIRTECLPRCFRFKALVAITTIFTYHKLLRLFLFHSLLISSHLSSQYSLWIIQHCLQQ